MMVTLKWVLTPTQDATLTIVKKGDFIMFIVVNRCFGGFGLSQMAIEALGVEYDFEVDRCDERLVNLINTFGSEAVSGTYAKLDVVEIPEDATDWELDEYDGCENIICVIDGKIQHL